MDWVGEEFKKQKLNLNSQQLENFLNNHFKTKIKRISNKNVIHYGHIMSMQLYFFLKGKSKECTYLVHTELSMYSKCKR